MHRTQVRTQVVWVMMKQMNGKKGGADTIGSTSDKEGKESAASGRKECKRI